MMRCSMNELAEMSGNGSSTSIRSLETATDNLRRFLFHYVNMIHSGIGILLYLFLCLYHAVIRRNCLANKIPLMKMDGWYNERAWLKQIQMLLKNNSCKLCTIRYMILSANIYRHWPAALADLHGVLFIIIMNVHC